MIFTLKKIEGYNNFRKDRDVFGGGLTKKRSKSRLLFRELANFTIKLLQNYK